MTALELYSWFLEVNKASNLEGVKLLRNSNVSVTVFIESFNDIILSDTARVEGCDLKFESDNIRKVAGGYQVQLFAYAENNLIRNLNN